MKRNIIPKPAMVYLIIGLLFTTTLTPLISHYFQAPDLLKGFITGLGLALEVFGIIKIRQIKKGRNCMASNTQDS